jgi:enoyl-CoA hydratase/carnithine racemase
MFGMSETFETLEFKVGDRVATIIPNRPDHLNAFNRSMAHEMMRIGLESEVTSDEDLRDRAHDIAKLIAGKPAAVIEGPLKAIWRALDKPRSSALADALNYPLLSYAIGRAELAAEPVEKLPWRMQ